MFFMKDREMRRFFFAVGFPRSGTTMLAGVMASNQFSVATPETNYFNLFLSRRYIRLKFDISAKDLDLDERISDLGVSITDEVVKGLSGGLVLEKILELYSEKYKRDIVIEKTPRHFDYIPEILSLDKTAGVVTIVRDPRAVILSNLKAGFRKNKDVYRMAMDWRHSSKTVRKFENNPRVKVVKYENIVSGGESEISGLYEFMGLSISDYSPELSSTNHIPDWERSWKRTDTKLQNLAKDSWKEELSERQIKIIESICFEDMSYWGYNCSSGGSALTYSYSILKNGLYLAKSVLRKKFLKWVLNR